MTQMPEYNMSNNGFVERRRMPRNQQHYQQPKETLSLDIYEVIEIIWSQRGLIAGVTALSLVLASIWLIFQVPEYKAHAIVQIDSRKFNVMEEMDTTTSNLPQHSMAIQSEVDVLKSPYLSGLVVDKLDLTKYMEFNSDIAPKGVLSWLKADNIEKSAAHIRNSTVNSLMKNRHISLVPRSLTINLYATSNNPELAAEIANTLAQEYINEQIRTRFKANTKANKWLTTRLKEIKGNLISSENAVQVFREKHNLFDKQGVSINDEQLSDISSQLILARAELAEAQARLKQTKNLSKGSIATITKVLNSPLIQKLSEQEAEVVRKKADLSVIFGSKHPKMISIIAEHEDLKKEITREVKKIITGLKNEVEVIKSRVKSLNESIVGAQDLVGKNTAAEVELNGLLREVNTNKSIYESFLSRSKETEQQVDLAKSDSHIISPAYTPLEPFSPKKSLTIALSLIMGFGVGIMIALLQRYMDKTFRTSGQIERILGYASLGIFPKFSEANYVLEYLKEKPNSMLAESLRKIKSSIHFSNMEKTPKVIMLTSSLPNEGKTIFTISLAYIAAKEGLKVLVIDGDMRRASLSDYLHINSNNSFADVLRGDATLKETLLKDSKYGFSVLPSKSGTEGSNQLMSSKKMDDLLDKLRDHFDLILLDTPPLGALADSMSIAHKVDSTAFLVRAGKTKQDVAMAAIKQLRKLNLPVAGIILTQVDIRAKGKAGYDYSYQNYDKYYHD